MIVNGLGKTKNEMSMVTALRAVVVATAVTQPKDSTMPKTEDTPTNTTLMSKLRNPSQCKANALQNRDATNRKIHKCKIKP